MENRKSFILYTDQCEIINALTDEQAGKLLRAVFAFVKGEEVSLDKITELAFIPIKQTLIRDNEKWLNIIQRNKKNIAKRWIRKDTKNTTGIAGIPYALDSDSDSDSDSDKKKINIPDVLKTTRQNPYATSESITPQIISDIAKKYKILEREVSHVFDQIKHKSENGGLKKPVKDWKQTLNNWVYNAIYQYKTIVPQKDPLLEFAAERNMTAEQLKQRIGGL